MHLSDLLSQFTGNGALVFSVLIITGVILVNGWTDAPTAIATCISTKTITPRRAIALAAVMNFAGVFVMSKLGGKVIATIANIADFGNDAGAASLALNAALLAIVIWAVAAWFFGIPTSESHALVASLSGAALALGRNADSISKTEWAKVIFGLLLSTFLGFFLGWLTAKLVSVCIKNTDRTKTDRIFHHLQNFSAAFMAFMHGAQDGQKFIGVFLLAVSLANGDASTDTFTPSVPLIVYCSAVMAIGTSVGGMRIIKSMGLDMVRLQKYQGFSADFAGAVSLLIATLTGLPVSTTHTKTTAIMGVGAAKRLSSVDWKIVKEMLLTWALTFPGCGFLGYLITVLFLR